MHISNRQQFVKRALKIIAFVLLAVLLLEGMSKVLMPRSNSGTITEPVGFTERKKILWI